METLNRRGFLAASALLATPFAASGTIVQPQYAFTTVFLDLFKSIKIPAGHEADFPLDLLAPKDRTIIGHFSNQNSINRGDWLKVPNFILKDKTELGLRNQVAREAAHLVLAAATDRNIVYFKTNSKVKLTNSFIEEYQNTFNQWSKGKLTDIYISDKHPRWAFKDTTTHFIPERDFTYLERYFKYQLNGSLPGSRKNLIIGVDSRGHGFVNPIWQPIGKHSNHWSATIGIAILNNKNVMLGAF